MTHSPIWTDNNDNQQWTIERDGEIIASGLYLCDATLICKAVNAHDDLVAALKAADEVFQRMLGADYPTPPGSAPALVKAALAKAGAA